MRILGNVLLMISLVYLTGCSETKFSGSKSATAKPSEENSQSAKPELEIPKSENAGSARVPISSDATGAVAGNGDEEVDIDLDSVLDAEVTSNGKTQNIKIGTTCLKPGDVKGPVSIALEGNSNFAFEGSLCFDNYEDTESSHYLFLVDISGSMRTQDPSCKRIDALYAMIQKAKLYNNPTNPSSYSIVLFNNKAEVLIEEGSLLDFSVTEMRSSVCRSGRGTNYQDAFLKAIPLVKPDQNVSVTLLSDGVPTADNNPFSIFGSRNQPFEKGLEAANQLRLKGVKHINTLFLLNESEAMRYASPKRLEANQKIQDYLKSITQDEARIQLVDSAENLVDAAGKVDTIVGALSKNQLAMEMEFVDGSILPLNVNTLIQQPGEQPTYAFSSEEKQFESDNYPYLLRFKFINYQDQLPIEVSFSWQ